MTTMTMTTMTTMTMMTMTTMTTMTMTTTTIEYRAGFARGLAGGGGLVTVA